MADQRNFRSAYLGKVGIKGVEEKTSIDLLLSEQPYDIEKLKQFCIRFPVPARHRIEIWKLLLDIVPPYQQTHEFVMRQRTEQYNDLRNAVLVMGKAKEDSPLPLVFLLMFHLQQGVLPFDQESMLQEDDSVLFMAMAESVLESVEEHQAVDAYWITHRFFNLQSKYNAEKQVLSSRIEFFVTKEDGENSKLTAHLVSLDAWNTLPFREWINNSFIGMLPGSSYERIWDKLLAGTCKILAFLGVAMILVSKNIILRAKTPADIVAALKKLDKAQAESIVSKALELLQKHGTM